MLWTTDFTNYTLPAIESKEAFQFTNFTLSATG